MTTWNQLKTFLEENYKRLTIRSEYEYSKKFCKTHNINFEKFKEFAEDNGGYDDVDVLLNTIGIYVNLNEDINKTLTNKKSKEHLKKGSFSKDAGLNFKWSDWK